MKKILAILLSVVMLLGCVVISTAAGENDATAFEIGAGVNYVPVVNENVKATLGGEAAMGDCQYGKIYNGIRTNDKFEFVIDVETAGTYYFSLSCTWCWDTTFAVSVDGGEETTLNYPAVPDWGTIGFSTPTAVELPAGKHTIVIRHTLVDSGANNLFAINICDSADAEIVYPIWRYAASAMAPHGHNTPWGAATGTYAYHANILEAFDGFGFCMPTWGNNTDAYCKIAVYNWAYNYENTLAGEPIATAEFNPMINEAWNGIDFEEPLPAGEYLFYIYDTSAENCGVYGYQTAEYVDENGVSYFNGVADTTFAPELNIKINAGFGEDTEIFGVASAETEVPAFSVDVAVDNKGVAENHGLTITSGVGGLGLSYQFKTNAAFKAFAPKLGLFCADRTVEISITKRGSDEPIQTWTKVGDSSGDNYWDDRVNNGAWVTCELDEELPAGEYIVAIAPANGTSDVLWKKSDIKDELGLFESVGSFDGERETARNSTPAFKVTFTEELEDGAYFAKAGEPNVVAVDNQGAEVGHGLTITNNVGGVSVSYQFKTNAAFESFSIMFGYFSADKNINVTIYDLNDELIQTWNPSGNEGVEATDSTGVWTAFELDEVLPAGEYIIVVDPTADTSDTRDVIWKRYDVVDANGIFHSTFAAEDEWAVKATPCLTFTFTEFAEDDVYFAKAGETPVEPPVEPETTAPETTTPEAPETTAPETTAPETTAPETTAPETTAPETTVADTTVADTTAAATTAAGTEAGTAAGTGATGTKAPATTTAAAASEGCKAVVGSMSAIALVAIASAAAVVLKKKED